MECCSAHIDNVEGLKGNDCQLKKWYREWKISSDDCETHGGRIGGL